MSDTQKMYTTTEVANILQLKPITIRSYVRKGYITVNRIGDRNLVTQQELDRLKQKYNISK